MESLLSLLRMNLGPEPKLEPTRRAGVLDGAILALLQRSGSKSARRLAQSKTCRFTDPQDPDFEIRVRPQRHEPDMFYVNKNMKYVEVEMFS